MMTSPVPGGPSHWTAYVGVDDIVASTGKANSLGAAVVQDVMDVADYGRMSVIVDPTGATIASLRYDKTKSAEQAG